LAIRRVVSLNFYATEFIHQNFSLCKKKSALRAEEQIGKVLIYVVYVIDND